MKAPRCKRCKGALSCKDAPCPGCQASRAGPLPRYDAADAAGLSPWPAPLEAVFPIDELDPRPRNRHGRSWTEAERARLRSLRCALARRGLTLRMDERR